MATENETLFSMLKREPQQAELILKAGIAGAFVIVLWDFLAGLVLPPLAVALVMLALILAYAGILTYLIAKLVRSADKWQVESALQAKNLMLGDSRTRRGEPVAEPQLQAVSTTSFHRTYFLLRLTEEVQRARREGGEMCVMALDATVPGHDLTQEVAEKVSRELAGLAASQAKVIGQPLITGPTEFVFSLPGSDARAGRDFVRKVVQGLGNYWCHFGLAVYPTDATDAESLFNKARQQCDESRHDGQRSSQHVSSAQDMRTAS
jgi:GGDEF domain-containing protein